MMPRFVQWSVSGSMQTACLELLPHVGIKRIFGCYEAKVEESENKPQVSWVRFLATDGLFTFLYFRLITSNMRTVQSSLWWQRWTLEILCSFHASCKLDKRPTFTSRVDLLIFKAHSVRGASTTAAFNKGLTIENILILLFKK